MEDGRTQEAIDMILDTLMFARDVGSNGPLLPTLVGDAVYSLTFDEIRRLLSSGKLTPSQLAELENKLQIVDRDFPSLATAMANDNLSLGMAVINGNEAGGSMREWVALAVQGGWRYGFSTKHMALDAFEERESHLRRAQAAEGFVNAKSREEIRAIESSGAASVNPMVQQLMPSYAKSDEAHREVLARLRLLRAVVGFLRTGTVPQIDDPLGTHILHSQNGGKTKIWSVGINEKDDGGIGSWSHDRPADIVIEMQK
jgi:hypothetical protein